MIWVSWARTVVSPSDCRAAFLPAVSGSGWLRWSCSIWACWFWIIAKSRLYMPMVSLCCWLGEDTNTTSASCPRSISSWCSSGESLWCKFPVEAQIGLFTLDARVLEDTPGSEAGTEPSDRWCSIDWWLWGELRSSMAVACSSGVRAGESSWIIWAKEGVSKKGSEDDERKKKKERKKERKEKDVKEWIAHHYESVTW